MTQQKERKGLAFTQGHIAKVRDIRELQRRQKQQLIEIALALNDCQKLIED